VDTPLITLCDLTPGKWLKDLDITNGTIFAYAMNNYWMTNYKAGQDGAFTFRYSLTSDQTIDPAAASTFGESVQTGLQAVRVDAPAKAGGLPAARSFCQVQPANVELTALKPADDGRGIILRIHETAGKDTDVDVKIAFPGLAKVSRCDIVERVQEPVKVDNGRLRVKLGANAMATYRLE
jgi:alpha-mannosidase